MAGPSHRITIRVRYNECDPMGIAHHAAYPVWLEMGRTELLRAGAIDQPMNYRDLESIGVFLAVVDLHIRYRKPARYDDVITLRTTLVEVTHVRIRHEYELTSEGLVLATGESTLACLDREGRPQPVPEFLRSTPAPMAG